MRTTIALAFILLAAGCLPLPPTPATIPPAAPTAAASTPPPATVERAGPTVPPAMGPAASPLPEASDSMGDLYYPQLGNGGYDALHYTLDLAVDMESGAISGTVTLAAQATADLRAFNLDFQGFDLRSVVVGDQPAVYRRTAHELTIAPATPIHNGETFTTTLRYDGVPHTTSSEAIPIPLGWNRYDQGVYVVSEPDGAAAWYPVNDHPRDKATYTFRITVPKPYIAAANGLLRQTLDNGDTRTYVWECRSPLASYLATVNIGQFVQESGQGPNGLPIRNFFSPGLAANARVVFAPTAAMIDYFDDLFGPYPFEAYGVAVNDQVLGYALETQTLSVFGRDFASAAPEQVEPIVAHELAHQWFGDSVSVANWQDIWLNEGFATYAEWLWQEHTEGPQARDESVRSIYRAAAGAPPPGRPPPNNLFNGGVYGRGALTLHALRLRVGDGAFFRTLQTYTERYRYGNASTADFIAVAEEVSQQDLGTLFDAWLYGKQLPEIPELGLKPAR